jgi:very-short-patch-repair endonuclease
MVQDDRGLAEMRGPQPWRTNRARALRSRQASAEEKLWEELRSRRLSGFKFIRQAAIGSYFADFVCRERKLVVEVDGATHGSDAEIANDATRTANLESMGYRVRRVTNDDVERNMDGVLEWLLRELEVGR